MYGIFVLIGILLWSSVSKSFFLPSLWTLELAQFAMVAYYVLGGPYSIQLDANVRMDLLYGRWSQIGRASCRERVCQYVLISVVAGSLKKKQRKTINKHIN